MQAERPSLNRGAGDIETGIADVLQPRRVHQAPHAPPPRWLTTWETRRPPLVMECTFAFLLRPHGSAQPDCRTRSEPLADRASPTRPTGFAEFLGVFFYVFL